MSVSHPSTPESDIEIAFRFFAGAAELVGHREIRMSVASGAVLRDVVRQLVEQTPQLGRLAGLSRWAVGNEFITDDFEFVAAATVAMIPPVSGG